MNKIIAGFLAFLLWLMPWSGTLYGLHAQFSFDRKATWTKIANCVRTHDVATLESMMRPWLKTNVLDLTDQLRQLYDAIDGNIISINDGGQGSSNAEGFHSERLEYAINTDTSKLYYLVVWYDTSNSMDRKEVGIGAIWIATGTLGSPDRVVYVELRAPEWQPTP